MTLSIRPKTGAWNLDKQQVVDLTWPIGEGLSVAPEYPPVKITHASATQKGDPANAEEVVMGLHVGTHVDTPAHFFDERETIDRVDALAFSGTAVVVDVPIPAPGWHEITGSSLKAWEDTSGETIAAGDIVIFRTGYALIWSALPPGPRTTEESWPFLGSSALDFLIARSIKAVGVETPDPDRRNPTTNEAHTRLLGAGIFIIEHLAHLEQIPVVRFDLLALGLPFENCSGSPIRALALI